MEKLITIWRYIMYDYVVSSTTIQPSLTEGNDIQIMLNYVIDDWCGFVVD